MQAERYGNRGVGRRRRRPRQLVRAQPLRGAQRARVVVGFRAAARRDRRHGDRRRKRQQPHLPDRRRERWLGGRIRRHQPVRWHRRPDPSPRRERGVGRAALVRRQRQDGEAHHPARRLGAVSHGVHDGRPNRERHLQREGRLRLLSAGAHARGLRDCDGRRGDRRDPAHARSLARRRGDHLDGHRAVRARGRALADRPAVEPVRVQEPSERPRQDVPPVLRSLFRRSELPGRHWPADVRSDVARVPDDPSADRAPHDARGPARVPLCVC